MDIRRITKIKGGQDGAIFGKYLFRLGHKGVGQVYDLDIIESAKEGSETCQIAEFTLDRADIICPHSNSVAFGNEYFDANDEFPLLYSNIYNNYAKEEKKLKGVSCVYRLQRDRNEFKTTLVQLIEIGFTEDVSLWKASEEKDGARPYGNFAIDVEKDTYYAFVMRSEERGTPYFAFDLPKLADGEIDKIYGVKKVVLTPNDIKNSFVCPEHHYIQGACCHGGLIYSLEGFRNSPALRIIDPQEGIQKAFRPFSEHGIIEETELIDFRGDECFYGDCHGALYKLKF